MNIPHDIPDITHMQYLCTHTHTRTKSKPKKKRRVSTGARAPFRWKGMCRSPFFFSFIFLFFLFFFFTILSWSRESALRGEVRWQSHLPSDCSGRGVGRGTNKNQARKHYPAGTRLPRSHYL